MLVGPSLLHAFVDGLPTSMGTMHVQVLQLGMYSLQSISWQASQHEAQALQRILGQALRQTSRPLERKIKKAKS